MNQIMKHIEQITTGCLATLLLLAPSVALAQADNLPSAAEVAKDLGFSEAEIEQIKGGTILRKDLKEGSEKELAGVVAAFFKQPLTDLAEKAINGKFLESDPTKQVQVWKPEASADEQFAAVALAANDTEEANYFL